MDLTAAGTGIVAGLRPGRAATPASTDEVADLVRAANAAGEAIVLWGGGTRIEVGDAPERYDLALELGRLRGVVEHAPADLVCTVRAGTTLAELERSLAGASQRWPVEAPDPERATVGGTIASAAAGPSRLRYQHPRDWIIGCEAVLGDGTVARAGGRVVKNVTGYDLTRLYSGTYGTLAVLTEVTLKLVATPERVRSLAREDTAARLWDAARALRASRLPLDAVALTLTPGSARLVVRLAGSSAAVERLAREISAPHGLADADEGEWGAIGSLPSRAGRVVRVSTRPGTERDAIGEVRSALVYPDTGAAFVFDALDARAIRALRARAEAGGGAVVIERAPDEVRRAAGTWGTPRLPLAVARALKDRFDPRAVLAPGRVPV